MSQPIRSHIQSPIPRCWSNSAPLPSVKEKPICDRCNMELIQEIINLRFNGKTYDFCSKTCLKIWIWKVIK